jgi:hypothetical protein
MPVYQYEHVDEPCGLGRVYEVQEAINDLTISQCPECGGMVRKLMSSVHFSRQRSDSELRDKGFTKLVRREDGVYENVTARHGESRYVDQSKPETLPHLHKTITD